MVPHAPSIKMPSPGEKSKGISVGGTGVVGGGAVTVGVIVNCVTSPSELTFPVAKLLSSSAVGAEVDTVDTESPVVFSASIEVVWLPPKYLLISINRLPAAGLYKKGVCKLILMSKSFGPPADPVSALFSGSDPL